MPIVIKHNGNVAPTLVGAYGGGLGRRYAEQSDDALRAIHARQAAAARAGGGIVRVARAGGKSDAQIEAEAQGLIGPGGDAIGGRPANRDAFAPLGRWNNNRETASPADLAEQIQIRREGRANAESERRSGIAEQTRMEREQREADEAIQRENPFAARDVSKWGEAQKVEFRKLSTAYQKAKSSMTPKELQALNAEMNSKISEISAMPAEEKPTTKIEGFGEGLTEIPEGTIRRLSDGTIIKREGGKTDITPPPKAEKPEKPMKPMFDTSDMMKFLDSATKEFTSAETGKVTGSPKEIEARAMEKAKAAKRMMESLQGGGDGERSTPKIVGNPVQDPESKRWFANTEAGTTVEVKVDDSMGVSASQSGSQPMNDAEMPTDTPPGWNLPHPKTKADLDALPPGQYVAPDGTIREKK